MTKITPDFEGRDDEYDDDTIRYWESHEDGEYYYELYVLVDGRVARIVVTNFGVSVDFKDEEGQPSESIHTNIVPNRLFGETEKLSWNQLLKIVSILESIGIEGTKYSKKEMDEMYEKWKKLTGNE
jgi:hypothetical protein